VSAASATSEPFGTLADGRAVERWTLRAGALEARVLSYGGVLQALLVPGRDGERANVLLGFADLAGYTDPAYLAAPAYFGALVGRNGNRIAGARFELDGRRYELAATDGASNLHSGPDGFDTRLWRVAPLPAGAGAAALELAYDSPAGESGFPGMLRARVRYTLDGVGLRIDYAATTDAPTLCNPTSHGYFNLAGEETASVLEQRLQLRAGRYLPVDATLIPTGELAAVAGTPFDFRAPRAVGARIEERCAQIEHGAGYDHCLVLDGGRAAPAARLHDPGSGRVMTVTTSAPAIQVYASGWLDGSLVGSGGRPYERFCALALETQQFPDAPHHAHFPSTVLRPGSTFRSTTRLAFSLA